MAEGCCNEHAGTKMTGEEEEAMRDWEGGESSDDDWKGACYEYVC